MDHVILTARSDRERCEREHVASEVRNMVATSGLTRQEFAARIGTSASRLSTYANGKVVPSAALMVRMRRLISRAAQ